MLIKSKDYQNKFPYTNIHLSHVHQQVFTRNNISEIQEQHEAVKFAIKPRSFKIIDKHGYYVKISV